MSVVERSRRLKAQLEKSESAHAALSEMLEAVTTQHVETLAKLSSYELHDAEQAAEKAAPDDRRSLAALLRAVRARCCGLRG